MDRSRFTHAIVSHGKPKGFIYQCILGYLQSRRGRRRQCFSGAKLSISSTWCGLACLDADTDNVHHDRLIQVSIGIRGVTLELNEPYYQWIAVGNETYVSQHALGLDEIESSWCTTLDWFPYSDADRSRYPLRNGWSFKDYPFRWYTGDDSS